MPIFPALFMGALSSCPDGNFSDNWGIRMNNLSGADHSMMINPGNSGALLIGYDNLTLGHPTLQNGAVLINGNVGIGTTDHNQYLSVIGPSGSSGKIAGFGNNGVQDLFTIGYNAGTTQINQFILRSPAEFKRKST